LTDDKIGTARDINRRLLLNSGVHVIGDLRDIRFTDRLISEYQPDTVIHTAASAIVSAAQNNPRETFESNVIGTVNLLESIRRLSTKHPYFLLLSTDKVLGESVWAKEDSPYPWQTLGPYEQSKAFQEILSLSYGSFFDVCVLRSCNTYGPGDTHSRIIPNVIRECLRGENPKVFDTESTRQYIYVLDLVSAILTLSQNRKTGIYHAGTSDIYTQVSVVNTIIEEYADLGKEFLTKPLHMVTVPDDPRRKQYLWYIKRQSLDSTKLEKLGWSPRMSFREGIRKTIQWWLEGRIIYV
jgi:nucleoside-diphosphate-sugar epimerase